MTAKSRKRMQDLEGRVGAIAAKLENQAITEWVTALSEDKLDMLLAFIKGRISADTPIPRDVLAILQTRPSS